MNINRVQSFKQFDAQRGIWTEVRRSAFLDPLWHSEARQQNGLIVASRTLTPAQVQGALDRHAHKCEITLLS